jgi:hypothetical protein
MRQLLINKLKLAQDHLWELTVSTESDFKYRGFVEDWSEDELILKYVGAEQSDRCIVERWLPINTITEVAYIRESNLDEDWLISDYENSLRFASENPGDESDAIIEELFEDFDDYDCLEGST